MDTASRVVVAIVVGITVVVMSQWLASQTYNCLWDSCAEPQKSLERIICGPRLSPWLGWSEWTKWNECHNSVGRSIQELCERGAPIWGAIAFAVTFFRLPKSRKEPPSE